jgi:hypothetical protein
LMFGGLIMACLVTCRKTWNLEHFLYFLPLPQERGSFRSITLAAGWRVGARH